MPGDDKFPPKDAPLLSADALFGDDEDGEDAEVDADVAAFANIKIASNDEWAFRRADRLVEQAGPGRRRRDTDRRTESEVFDRSTLLVLHNLLLHGVLKSLDHPISTGKEANVFRGTTPRGGYLAVKIYRVNTATFKHVLKYIQGDERFEGVTSDKRGLVHAWCQKEYRNLLRMREVGLPVPEPLKSNQNVLVTEFLGTKAGAWPKLREVQMTDPARFYKQAVDQILQMHNRADLIHADWSEYNVLVANADQDESKWQLRPIDVGQAVLKNHPMAAEFLERDVKNLCHFFKRLRVRVDPQDILGHLNHERNRDLDDWVADEERRASGEAPLDEEDVEPLTPQEQADATTDRHARRAAKEAFEHKPVKPGKKIPRAKRRDPAAAEDTDDEDEA